MDDRKEPEAAGPHDAAERGGHERPLPGVQESLRQYSTLLEINNALISNLTRESLFHAISEALRKVVPFDRALLYVAEKDVLRTIALEGAGAVGALARCAQGDQASGHSRRLGVRTSAAAP
jgi:GAF domain-containing protein